MKNFFYLFFLLLSIYASDGLSMVEFKSNLFGSFMIFGRNDIILNTHNTVLVGSNTIKVGAFYSYESFSRNTIDTSQGMAIRIGEDLFAELQIGSFQRQFTGHTTLKGKGFIGNIFLGKHFGKYFGLSLLLSFKKINSGMDKQLIFKGLPFFGLRVGF